MYPMLSIFTHKTTLRFYGKAGHYEYIQISSEGRRH